MSPTHLMLNKKQMIYSTTTKRPTVNHIIGIQQPLSLIIDLSHIHTHTIVSFQCANLLTTCISFQIHRHAVARHWTHSKNVRIHTTSHPWTSSHLTHTHFSPTTGFFHSDCTIFVLAERHLKILSTSSISHTHTLAHEDILQHPALADISKSLWTTHKYDVGLIKNFFPVVIIPKSDYRPTCNQYPLGFWNFTESSCN